MALTVLHRSDGTRVHQNQRRALAASRESRQRAVKLIPVVEANRNQTVDGGQTQARIVWLDAIRVFCYTDDMMQRLSRGLGKAWKGIGDLLRKDKGVNLAYRGLTKLPFVRGGMENNFYKRTAGMTLPTKERIGANATLKDAIAYDDRVAAAHLKPLELMDRHAATVPGVPEEIYGQHRLRTTPLLSHPSYELDLPAHITHRYGNADVANAAVSDAVMNRYAIAGLPIDDVASGSFRDNVARLAATQAPIPVIDKVGPPNIGRAYSVPSKRALETTDANRTRVMVHSNSAIPTMHFPRKSTRGEYMHNINISDVHGRPDIAPTLVEHPINGYKHTVVADAPAAALKHEVDHVGSATGIAPSGAFPGLYAGRPVAGFKRGKNNYLTSYGPFDEPNSPGVTGSEFTGVLTRAKRETANYLINREGRSAFEAQQIIEDPRRLYAHAVRIGLLPNTAGKLRRPQYEKNYSDAGMLDEVARIPTSLEAAWVPGREGATSYKTITKLFPYLAGGMAAAPAIGTMVDNTTSSNRQA